MHTTYSDANTLEAAIWVTNSLYARPVRQQFTVPYYAPCPDEMLEPLKETIVKHWQNLADTLAVVDRILVVAGKKRGVLDTVSLEAAGYKIVHWGCVPSVSDMAIKNNLNPVQRMYVGNSTRLVLWGAITYNSGMRSNYIANLVSLLEAGIAIPTQLETT